MTESGILGALADRERPVVARFHRIGLTRAGGGFFRGVSVLGALPFWVALMAALPLVYGRPALAVVATMLAASGGGLVVDLALKLATRRPRPAGGAGHGLGLMPLRHLSFPSSHAIHATALAVVVLAHYPGTAPLVLPATGLVLLSRLALGVHFPSDVVAGAALGGLVAVGAEAAARFILGA